MCDALMSEPEIRVLIWRWWCMGLEMRTGRPVAQIEMAVLIRHQDRELALWRGTTARHRDESSQWVSAPVDRVVQLEGLRVAASRQGLSYALSDCAKEAKYPSRTRAILSFSARRADGPNPTRSTSPRPSAALPTVVNGTLRGRFFAFALCVMPSSYQLRN
jgi:hypothetical protein